MSKWTLRRKRAKKKCSKTNELIAFHFIETMCLKSFVVLIFFGFCTEIVMTDCPRLCECKWRSGKESVLCLKANLSAVPNQLETGTQILDLTGNNLVAIKNDEFRIAGLVNLQRVYISKCRLKTLERFCFRSLINLVELDLSYNVLTSIPSHTFDSIAELRELKLSGNPIQRINNEAFTHLPQLNRLEIVDSKLNIIEPKAFVGLEQSLMWLKLDKNRLSNVMASSFTILNSIQGLELASNPWNCSCSLRPLREWMLRQNVPFGIPPVCQYPKRLEKKPWDKLELDEFACVPEIFAYDNKAYGIEGKNITMTCRIAGVPEPNVRWILKNKVIANLSSSPYSNGKKLYVMHLQNSSSDLTIFSADLQDAGTYTCTAENKAGKAEASVTLAVSKKPPETGFSNRILTASAITGIIFVLLSCLITVCVYAVRKKHFLKWNRRECRREDNYEKIEMNHKAVSGAGSGVGGGSGNNANGGSVVPNDVPPVVNRKNGEYRVVPSGDTDQEVEEDDDGGLEVVLQKNNKSWSVENEIENRWNSPEHLLDPDDLHIPRRTIQESRDNIKKTFNSMCGTYKPYQPSTSKGNIQHLLRCQPPANTFTTSIYATTCNRELSSLTPNSSEKKFPDLIKNSSPASISRTHSDGGSVSDINELFCTLPRKKPSFNHNNSRYKSTDSQSPLLPDSRYGSSGGESSYSSQEIGIRRLSDAYKYPVTNLKRNRVNKISNSFLNLTREENTSSPSSSELSSTPLLDVSSLEHRVMFKRQQISTTSSAIATIPNSNSYDYHAAQLERFLEEYRSLQEQLTKMKEKVDCCQERTQCASASVVSPANPSSSNEHATVNHPLNVPIPSNSNHSLQDSVDFRNFENELTKYLLSQSSSHKNLNSSGGVFNN